MAQCILNELPDLRDCGDMRPMVFLVQFGFERLWLDPEEYSLGLQIPLGIARNGRILDSPRAIHSNHLRVLQKIN